MIVVKPKISTQFSLGVFIAASLSLGGYAGNIVFINKNPDWYHYMLLIIFAPIGLGLLMRMIFKYKIIQIGKGSINIKLPTRFINVSYDLNDIKHWRETAIKTAGGKYKELEILFDDQKRLHLSMQEHSDYNKVVTYLKKKVSKKLKQ